MERLNTFQGETFDPALDGERLNTQYRRVMALMLDHEWRTLGEISEAVKGSEASVSARLRDFRKIGYRVERRRRGDPRSGLFEYQLLPPEFEFEEMTGQGKLI